MLPKLRHIEGIVPVWAWRYGNWKPKLAAAKRDLGRLMGRTAELVEGRGGASLCVWQVGWQGVGFAEWNVGSSANR